MSRRIRRLKPKKIKGRIAHLQAMPYKKIMIYIRMIDGEIFEYLIPYKGQIWTDYIVIKPEDGRRKLTKDEINQAAALSFAGATTTIDVAILKDTKIDKKTKKIIKSFEGSKKQVESMLN